MNLFHIAFITTISVFFKEFIYFLIEYFEDLKLKDSIGKSNSKGSIAKNIPSILNKDDGSSNKPEDSGSGAQASGSGTQGSGSKGSEEHKSILGDWRNYQYDSDSDSGAQASGSGTQYSGAQASGSGTQDSGAQGSEDKSIADDLRNYQYDSDSDSGSVRDYSYFYESSTQEAKMKPGSLKYETNEGVEDHNTFLGESKAQFEAKVAKMENSESIQNIKATLRSAKLLYEINPNVPASKPQIPILEAKIAMCDSRISELEAENTNPSQDKGKGKANE